MEILKSNKSAFRQYLEQKDFAEKTITAYVKYAEQFFAKTGKEDIAVTKPDVLMFLEYLKNKRGLQNAFRRHYLDALKHYFDFLQTDGQTDRNPCSFLKIRGQKRKTLYKIYTPEELEQIFDSYYQLFIRGYDDSRIPPNRKKQTALSKERNAVILSVLINQGATTEEIERIKTGDIDLSKATLKIRSRQHSNERTIPLKATQIGLFIDYLHNIRPQLLEYRISESEKLFLSLFGGSGKKENGRLNNIFVLLAGQIRTIDKQFVNFKQLRASVITWWLKTSDLRKAQYLAGHRYVSSTESYRQNSLDSLIDDINSMHPF